ncbi:MAG: COX15/CtaA family protein [Anaerolineae bacterium]|jgi:cytochrome c oxidase assembly protein subunit 15|nr:COX15/CtaA family protein [Anaerolineae bacterium]
MTTEKSLSTSTTSDRATAPRAAQPSARSSITRRHRNLLLAANISTALLVTMGAVVCATESGAACPDWPGCFGRAIPPPQIHSIIEYTHRLIALITTPLIVASAYLGWRRARSQRLIRWLPTIAIPFTLAVAAFGAFAVLTGLARGVAALDLGSALIVLMLVTATATAGWVQHADPTAPDRLSLRAPLAKLSAGTALAVYATYVGGILVAGAGSLTRCLSWPIWRVLPVDVPGWPQTVRLIVGVLAAALVPALVARVLMRRGERGLRTPAIVLLAAFAVAMLVGVIMMTSGATPFLAVVNVAAAVVVWCMLVVIATRAGLEAARGVA